MSPLSGGPAGGRERDGRSPDPEDYSSPESSGATEAAFLRTRRGSRRPIFRWKWHQMWHRRGAHPGNQGGTGLPTRKRIAGPHDGVRSRAPDPLSIRPPTSLARSAGSEQGERSPPPPVAARPPPWQTTKMPSGITAGNRITKATLRIRSRKRGAAPGIGAIGSVRKEHGSTPKLAGLIGAAALRRKGRLPTLGPPRSACQRAGPIIPALPNAVRSGYARPARPKSGRAEPGRSRPGCEVGWREATRSSF